jgi:hypothetical protein
MGLYFVDTLLTEHTYTHADHPHKRYERLPVPARLLWECDNMTTEQSRQLTALISIMKGDDCADRDNPPAVHRPARLTGFWLDFDHTPTEVHGFVSFLLEKELTSHTGNAPFNVSTVMSIIHVTMLQ